MRINRLNRLQIFLWAASDGSVKVKDLSWLYDSPSKLDGDRLALYKGKLIGLEGNPGPDSVVKVKKVPTLQELGELYPSQKRESFAPWDEEELELVGG